MNKNVDFLIIGFTGPIGSGCTTLSKIIGRIKPNGLIKRKNLYNDILSKIKSISISMKGETQQDKLAKLNNELNKCFQQKTYLWEIQKFKDPNFTYISMSSLITKIALMYLSTDEFKSWQKENPEISEIFIEFHKKWGAILDLYNNTDDKEFDELTETNLENIDEMFKDLDTVKDEIKKKELKLYFNKAIKEFHLQSFGDNLRRSGNPFNFKEDIPKESIGSNVLIIPSEVNRLIKYYRNRKDYKTSCCFIIDAFRNSIEVEYFKKRYAQFYLVSLYASYNARFNRLKKLFTNLDDETFKSLFNKLDERDLGQDDDIFTPFKQNVSRCCYLSDIAINNENDTIEFDNVLFEKFLKYYALMISPGCTQPTKEETYMNLAYTLSLRSSCISRKVGAVITDKDGFILGLGWNDVAHSEIGCGLRTKEDLVEHVDERFSLDLISKLITKQDLEGIKDNDSFCFKDVVSTNKIKAKLNKTNICPETQAEILSVLKVKRLEYCRALHAEENALLQVASRGGVGVNGGTIYTTTFPCELCAKKIYQSGIKKIFYTESYPNSISEDVFLKDGINKIDTKQFEGIKSFSYFRLFKPHLDRKEAQYLDEIYYNLF